MTNGHDLTVMGSSKPAVRKDQQRDAPTQATTRVVTRDDKKPKAVPAEGHATDK